MTQLLTARIGGDTAGSSAPRARWHLLGGVAMLSLLLGATTATAQAADPDGPTGPTKAAGTDRETVNTAGGKPEVPVDPLTGDLQEAPAAPGGGDIVVTGTRIVRDGYSAPTPVSVISSKEIQTEAPATISDFVNTLPAVRGSATSANSNGALSNGQAGIATVNLRSLGANRTLVLVDGQRTVGSAATGVADTNTIPQSLIQRVEVVTGGASSAYGSDAVSGVVNFILDKNFNGVKANYEFGIDDYGDGANHKGELTAGSKFGSDGQGHITLAGEYFTQKSQQTINRRWNQYGFFQIDNPAYNAVTNPTVPARIIAQGIGLSGSTPGGLITSAGPLRGTYFGANTAGANTPSINRLNFGAISGQWMQGGDYLITRDQHNGSSTLIPEEDRRNAFGRLSWKFSDALEVYGQASYSRYEGVSYYQKTYSTGVTIQRDNAYLPQAIRNSMVASNLSTIAVGFGNEGIPAQGSANKREVYRFLVGGNGEFELAGRDVKWDAYAQEGIVKADELLVNTYQTQYLARATDAVVVTAANVGNSGKSIGSIACRFSLSNPGDACVPINRFGLGNVTPEALNYIFNNGNQPLREQTLKQRVGGLTFSANNIFELPAGPVSLAFGAEVRKESITGTVDPQFSVDQSGPFRGVTKWIYGNYFPTIGSFDVKEAFVEAIVPVFKGFDVNGAFRATDYSTSGRVNTWKVGGTWQAIQDVKFRGTISRDIRAPNLQELFSIVGRSNAITVPAVGGLAAPRSDNFFENTVGNLDLRPEVAKTYGGGIVLTPTFLEGFAASVDYYKIKLSGAISAISAQTAVTLCYEQNLPQYCSGIQTANGLAAGPGNVSSPITGITLQSINFVAIKTRGLDFEASYRKMIGEGQVTLRALATHYISLYTNNGIDVPTEAAGQNAGNVPDWSFRLSANYEQGPFGFQIVGRGISSGKYDNSFIECTSGCPVSTVANRTINNNRIDGAWYVDVQSNYRFDVGPTRMQAFINIRNLLNEDPVLVANGPTGNNTPAYPQTNRVLYDVQGRIYRLGLRVAI